MEEKLALTARLIEQTQPNGDASSHPLPGNEQGSDDEPLDVSGLKLMPPEDSFEVQMQFVDGGLGEPARYDVSDIFGDDPEGIPDAFDLNRVPPKRTYTMQARYKFAGRLTPLPFELEEEE
ncbi:MAG: hypothetical protein ACREEM_00945 [Blastocatellia bacterium]